MISFNWGADFGRTSGTSAIGAINGLDSCLRAPGLGVQVNVLLKHSSYLQTLRHSPDFSPEPFSRRVAAFLVTTFLSVAVGVAADLKVMVPESSKRLAERPIAEK